MIETSFYFYFYSRKVGTNLTLGAFSVMLCWNDLYLQLQILSLFRCVSVGATILEIVDRSALIESHLHEHLLSVFRTLLCSCFCAANAKQFGSFLNNYPYLFSKSAGNIQKQSLRLMILHHL